jgi:hypothetical protein
MQQVKFVSIFFLFTSFSAYSQNNRRDVNYWNDLSTDPKLDYIVVNGQIIPQ